jgi:hypothetical protein
MNPHPSPHTCSPHVITKAPDSQSVNPHIRAQVASNEFATRARLRITFGRASRHTFPFQEFESRILEAMYLHRRSINITGDDDSAVPCADGISARDPTMS